MTDEVTTSYNNLRYFLYKNVLYGYGDLYEKITKLENKIEDLSIQKKKYENTLDALDKNFRSRQKSGKKLSSEEELQEAELYAENEDNLSDINLDIQDYQSMLNNYNRLLKDIEKFIG